MALEEEEEEEEEDEAISKIRNKLAGGSHKPVSTLIENAREEQAIVQKKISEAEKGIVPQLMKLGEGATSDAYQDSIEFRQNMRRTFADVRGTFNKVIVKLRDNEHETFVKIEKERVNQNPSAAEELYEKMQDQLKLLN